MTIEEIKQAVDIGDLAEHYGVKLKHDKACCPFHSERTPSFSVNRKKRIFKCFGCGAGGDIFTFVQRMTGSDFVSAKNEICAIYGLSSEPVNAQLIIKNDERRAKEIQFKQWVDHAIEVLNKHFRRLRRCINDYAPKSCLADADVRFVMAVQSIDMVEYWLDILCFGSVDEKIYFYKNHREEVAELDNRSSTGITRRGA